MSIIAKLIELDKKAKQYGFYRHDLNGPIKQIISECEEIKDVIEQKQGKDRLQEEVGDLLQAAIELCLYLKLDPYSTLDKTTRKYSTRLKSMAKAAKEAGLENLIGQDRDTKIRLWENGKIIAKQITKPVISTRLLTKDDIKLINQAFTNLGWHKPPSLFEKYLTEQTQDERKVFVARINDEIAGYVTLFYKSKYEHYKNNNIPEILDLNILPKFQNMGIGSKLLELAEEEAMLTSTKVGTSVSLTKDCSVAFRLYIKRGYMPDTEGVTYNYQPQLYGSNLKLDEALNIWLIKDLVNY